VSAALRILVAEDEAVIARRIARLTAEILGPSAGEIRIAGGVAEARAEIERFSPALLLLDLSLEGEDGFELIKEFSAGPFETVVISAHPQRALEAFDYGVRDFVAKPFRRERLERALRRVLEPVSRSERPVSHLGVRRSSGLSFVPVDRIAWVRARGTRSELVLAGGQRVLHNKMLDRLEGILPARFERVHRSFLVDLDRVRRFLAREGSRYALELEDGTSLPVGRSRVAALRRRLG